MDGVDAAEERSSRIVFDGMRAFPRDCEESGNENVRQWESDRLLAVAFLCLFMGRAPCVCCVMLPNLLAAHGTPLSLLTERGQMIGWIPWLLCFQLHHSYTVDGFGFQ